MVSASTIYPINQTPTTGDFFAGATSGASARGWEFQVNASNLSVVQLGVNAGMNVPVTLTLWDDATKKPIAQTVVTSTKGSWAFGDLTAPVALTKGDVYSVIGWANTTGGAWYMFSNDPPAEFRPTGDIEYLNSLYINGTAADTFPSGAIIGPSQYGLTDIGYASGVPEPMSFALAAGGLLLLFAARSRRSRS